MATSRLSTSKSRLSKSKTSYEELLNAAEASGQKAPDRVGVLTRVINLFSAFEPGGELATYVRERKTGASPISAAGTAGKQYASEVARGVGSVASPLDVYTKPNELRATQEGYSAFLEEVGMPETPINIAGKKFGSVRGAVGLAGDIVLDPGNLLLAGIFKAVGKGVGVVGKAATKTKIGGKVAEAIGEAFIPAYKAKKVAPELVDFLKTAERTKNFEVSKVTGEATDLIKKIGYKNFEKVASELDTAGKTGKAVSKEAQETVDLIQRVTKGELKLGLRKGNIEFYFPRKVIGFPGQEVAEGAAKTTNVPKYGATIKGYAKPRTVEDLAEGTKLGYKYEEAPQVLVDRLRTSVKAQVQKNTLNELVAGEIKGIDGTPLVKKIPKSRELLPDHVPVMIDKQGIQIGDRLLRFYPTYGETGQKIIAATKRKAIYQMPKDAAEYMAKANKVFGDNDAMRGVLKIWDDIMNIWKGSVTSYFPAFHVRNAMGNIFNNFVGGVKDPKVYEIAGSIQKAKDSVELAPDLAKLFPDVKTYGELKKIMAYAGVTSEGQFAVESTGTLEKILAGTPGKAGKLREGLVGVGRTVGTKVEDNARIAHFIDKVRKGASVADAAKSTNKFLFDYTDLTPFESNVLKRIMPFYTFTRKNIPLQIEQMIKQPKKYAMLLDAIEGLKSGDLTADEKKYMPDYIADTFGINVGRTEAGTPQILAGMNLPLEDISKIGTPLKSVIGMAAPFVKAPFEIASGYSTFYEKPIKDTSAYKYTTGVIGSIPGLKQFLQAKEREGPTGKYYEVNPSRMYAIKSLTPFGRLFATGEKLTDSRKAFILNMLNAATGIRIYTPDIAKEKEDQLIEMLKEMGILKTFTKEYVPKK